MASHNRRLVAAALLCFVLFTLFYGLTSRANLQVSDEAAVFGAGIALGKNGNLAIDDLQWLQDRINIGEKGQGGQLFAKYFPGNVLGIALLYRLTARGNDQPYFWDSSEMAPSSTGARWAMKINAVWGALAMAALLLLIKRYYDWRTAIVSVVLVGLCSDWWYQSRGLFSEVGAGAFLVLSLCFMAYESAWGSSLALAVSLLFRPTNLLALPIWGKAVWRKGLAALASGLFLVAGGVGLGVYNWMRFASPLNFGYGSEGFSASLLEGLYGILLSPGRSLFVYSPILLLAIPGAWLAYRKDKALAILCSVIVLGYAIAIAIWHSWDGGWTWGARLLAPIVPLLGFLVAPVIDYARRSNGTKLIVLVLGLAGLSVQLLALLRDPLRSLNEHVVTGEINFKDVLYTVQYSWPALQIRDLRHWQICDLDAYTLKQWLAKCKP